MWEHKENEVFYKARNWFKTEEQIESAKNLFNSLYDVSNFFKQPITRKLFFLQMATIATYCTCVKYLIRNEVFARWATLCYTNRFKLPMQLTIAACAVAHA